MSQRFSHYQEYSSQANKQNNDNLPRSISSSFVQGLSVSIQPLNARLSRVRSTVACGFPSWHIKSSEERLCCLVFLKGSGNSFSGHSQTLQSCSRHMPSSGQKGQSHHSFTWRNHKYVSTKFYPRRVPKTVPFFCQNSIPLSVKTEMNSGD